MPRKAAHHRYDHYSTSFKLSPASAALYPLLMGALGLTRSAIHELALRTLARKFAVEIPKGLPDYSKERKHKKPGKKPGKTSQA